jgi:hypothetical protein
MTTTMSGISGEEFARRCTAAERLGGCLHLRDWGQAVRAYRIGLRVAQIRNGQHEAYLAAGSETDLQHGLRRIGGYAALVDVDRTAPVRLTADNRLKLVGSDWDPWPQIPDDLAPSMAS